jgi:hypothetical protein
MNKPNKKKKKKEKEIKVGLHRRDSTSMVPTGTTEKRVFLRGGNTIVTLPGGQKVNFRDTTDNKCQPKGISPPRANYHTPKKVSTDYPPKK